LRGELGSVDRFDQVAFALAAEGGESIIEQVSSSSAIKMRMAGYSFGFLGNVGETESVS
jgi:hypothetical protein